MRLGRKDRNAPSVEELLDSDAARRAFEERLLLVNVQQELVAMIEMKSIKRQDIAERLGVSESRISQMLSGKENLTLRTVAGVGWAMGFRIEPNLSPIGEDDHLREPDEQGHGPTHYMLEEVRLMRERRPLERSSERLSKRPAAFHARVPQRNYG